MAINEYDALLQGEGSQANPYDAIVTDQVQHSQLALRGSMLAAAQTEPDRAAKVIKLSDRLKLPRQIVDRNYDALSKKYDLSDNEYSTLISENPTLSSWLSDPDNASVARDDVPVLQRIENTFYSFGRGWARASKQGDLADLLYKEVEHGLSPQEAARRDSLKLEQERFSNADKRNGVPEYVAGVTGYSARQMGSSIYAGAEGTAYGGVGGALAGSVLPGVGTVAGGTAGMIAGGLTASAAYSYRMETGFAFDELRSMKDVKGNPLDPQIARNAARAVGAINGIIETGSTAMLTTLVPGFNKVIGGLGGDQAKRAVLNEVKAALATPTRRQMMLSALGKMTGAASVEGIEEFLQSLVGAGGREVAQAVSGKTFAPDSVSEDIAKASREAMDAAVGTFFTFTPIGGARYFSQARQAAKAQQQQEFFTALGTGVAESKMFERMPERMQAFIEQATKDGPIDTVYMPVEQWVTYWQSKGLDPAQVASEVLGETQAYETALGTGADLAIPMSRYATRLAPTEHNSFLASELRLAPDAMNAREAAEFEKRLADEQKKAGEEQQAETHDEGIAHVQADVQAKLEAAGVETATAQAYASTYGAAFRSIAERSGMDARALYERYGLQIGRGETEQPGETALAQPPQDIVNKAIEIVGEQKFQELGERALLEERGKQALQGKPDITPEQRDAAIARLAQRIVETSGDLPSTFHQDTIDGDTGEVLPQPPFYSALERLVGAAKMDKAPAEQWKKYIEGLSSKGVKKEEIMMSGVLDWLDLAATGKQDVQTAKESVMLMSDGNTLVNALRAIGVDTKKADQINDHILDNGMITSKQTGFSADFVADLVAGFELDTSAHVVLSATKITRAPMVVPETVKRDSRVTRDEILNYLAASGVKVEEKILGEPATPEKIEVVDRKEGYILVRVADGYQIRDSSGARSATHNEARARELLEQAAVGKALPPSYDIVPVDGGFKVEDSDGNMVDASELGGDWETGEGEDSTVFETRGDAVTAAREHYIMQGFSPDDLDEESLKEKATELMQADIPEMARQYAQDSESTYGNFHIAVLPPDHKIVKVEGNKGIVDMFTGRDAPTHWRVVEIEFDDTPNDDYDAESSGRAEDSIPTDADEFWDMFGDEGNVTETALDGEFATEAEAIAFAKSKGLERDQPIWVPWNKDESSRFNEGETYYDEHEDWHDAYKAIESARESAYESEVEYYTNDHQWNVDDFGDRYYNLAREELARNDDQTTDFRERELERLDSLGAVRLERPRDLLAVRHSNTWQSIGGRDYRELVLSVPGIEAFSANDSTHFGTDTGGRTVAWARMKIHDDAKGVPTLFVEEIQSQRAQAGRESGFKDEQHQDGYVVVMPNGQKLFAKSISEAEATREKWLTEVAADRTGRALYKPEDIRIEPRLEPGEVPTAPFVKDTKAWVSLTMKRIIRYAADKGIHQIAWTQGQQNVDRYEGWLRDRVRRIEWKLTEGGKFEVFVKTESDGDRNVTWSDREMKSAFGAEMGGAIAQEVSGGTTSGVIEGDDIRMNDLGMAMFYGDDAGISPKGEKSIVTAVTEKIIKGLGSKAGVKRIDISVEESAQKSGKKTFEGAPGFELTPEMIDKAKGGFTLFQRGDDTAKRGRIRFTGERRFSIDLLEHADLSTFIHESGHFWLEVLGDIHNELAVVPADKLNEKQLRMRDDYATLLKWLGVEDRSKIGEPQHEKFARAIEAYFMEGKAPSSDLRAIFARVRAWMLSIYRSLTQLNVSLTPEVRDVFDRMFATDEQIATAQQEAAVEALFMKPEDSGMTPTEFAAYRGKVEKASAAARDELQAKLMKTLQREREQWWKSERARVRAEIAKDVNQRRDVIAYSVLVRDEMPDGADLPYDLQRVKMNRAEIDGMLGDGSWKNLPRGSTAIDGIGLQAVGDLLGYDSPDALLKAMRQAEPADRVIERETDQRMKAEHGDMLVDGTIVDAARQAVQNDERVSVIQAELKALAKLRREAKPAVDAEKRQAKAKIGEGLDALDRLIPALKDIRSAASRVIAGKLVRDLKPMQYLVAARRSSQSAVEAAGKGEWTFAIKAKQRELFNIELYRVSQSALDEVDTTVDYMQKFADARTRSRLGKAGQDYLDQIDGFLDRYEFARVPLKSLDRRKALAQWVAEKEKAGEPVNLPDDVVLEKRVNYKDMTIEELRGVRDSVKNIEHLARLKNKLLTSKRKQALDEVVGDIEDSIREHAKSVRGRKIETRLPGDEALRLIDSGFGLHRKLSSFIRQLDGFVDGGVLWEYVMRPINEAGDKEATMNAAATRVLKKLFDAYKGTDMSALYTKLRIDAIDESLSKMARLTVALNWGNDDNRQKIMDGYGWDQTKVAAILETLDERDWKFVQGVWDFIDSYWPEIEAKEKRVNGIAPEKVAPSVVKTRFGEFAGGYFPLKYDDRQSAQAYGDRVKEAAEQMMKGGYTRATTKRGHTKERVDGVRRPVRLDFGVIFEHVGQVVHDLSHHEMLIDVNRILGAKPVSGAVIEVYGDVAFKQMQAAVADIAAGNVPATGAFEKSMAYVRSGMTISGLAWNVFTSLLQPLGLSQSMVRIGVAPVARGLARWISDAAHMENTAAWIQEKSPMMKLRMATQLREINEIKNEIGVNTGKLSGWVDQALRTVTLDKVNKQAVADSFFWLIYKGQQVADIPTWLGAYEKAMGDTTNDEARAVALADQAVLDSQGGGQIKDLAGIQRGGPLLKVWTAFYSYFNVTYNLMVESAKRTNYRSPAQIGRLAVDYLMLTALPATAGALMKHALTGNDDDRDKLVEKLIRENISYLFGLMVGMREIGSVVQGYQGYEGPAGARFFSAIAKLVKQGEQGEADAAFWRALNESAGILLHYPAGQVRRTVEGYNALREGDTKNPIALLVGPRKP